MGQSFTDWEIKKKWPCRGGRGIDIVNASRTQGGGREQQSLLVVEVVVCGPILKWLWLGFGKKLKLAGTKEGKKKQEPNHNMGLK